MDELSFTTLDHGLIVLLFVAYLAGEYTMTYDAATRIYSKYGIIAAVLIMVSIFVCANPVVGLLGMVVGYTIIQRAISIAGHNYISEDTKWAPYETLTKPPETLEQQIIEQRVSRSFKPMYEQREVNSRCSFAGHASRYEGGQYAKK